MTATASPLQIVSPPVQTLNLIQKLAAVMAAVESVPKNGRNDFHRYDYATEADIGRAVRKTMASLGVMLIPSADRLEWREIETKGGGKERIATLHVNYTVTDGIEERHFTVVGEGQDRGDKAVYKAMTGAGKYALMKLFLIPTGDDPEHEGEEPARGAPAQRPANQAPAKRTLDERKRDLTNELTAFGYEPAGIKLWVKEVLGRDYKPSDEDMGRLESALVILRAEKNKQKAEGEDIAY